MTSFGIESSTAATKCNGWTNRETWVVNLWLTNEESYYEELYSIIKHFATGEQPEAIELYVRSIIEADERAGVASDLLTTSLGRVNWYEIAENNR